MGDIADMMLEGLLDEQTGEYIGDKNLERFGEEAPGFPVSYEDARPEVSADKVECPHCFKRVKSSGLKAHMHDAHGIGPTLKKARCGECGKKVKSTGLRDHMRDAHGI